MGDEGLEPFPVTRTRLKLPCFSPRSGFLDRPAVSRSTATPLPKHPGPPNRLHRACSSHLAGAACMSASPCRVGADQKDPAARQPDIRCLRLGSLATEKGPVLAAVELECLARPKGRRDEGARPVACGSRCRSARQSRAKAAPRRQKPAKPSAPARPTAASASAVACATSLPPSSSSLPASLQGNRVCSTIPAWRTSARPRAPSDISG